MTQPLPTAFRYMTRFECIAERCESTCCSGWEIQIDEAHFKGLKKKMSGSRPERDEFARSHEMVRGPQRSPGRHALVVLHEGRCSFLGADALCSVHKRYGEDTLADACAVYPRSMSISGGRRELAGSPSCPEVARQLLLRADALELVEVDASAFPRTLFPQSLPDAPVEAYLRHHDALRNLACDLLSDFQIPLAHRLFHLAWFASRASAHLRRSVAELDEARLAGDVEQILDPAFRRALDERFAAIEADDRLAVRLVLSLLKRPRNDVTMGTRATAFDEQVDAALVSYGRPASGATTEVTAEALVRGYREREASLAPEARARIDLALTNYAKNYWVREWYARSEDLLEHTEALLVRLAMIRFVLLGQPTLTDDVDGTLVAVIHRFARRFEHDARFAESLARSLAADGMRTLAHAVLLLRF